VRAIYASTTKKNLGFVENQMVETKSEIEAPKIRK
jgi:hypothetical protein